MCDARTYKFRFSRVKGHWAPDCLTHIPTGPKVPTLALAEPAADGGTLHSFVSGTIGPCRLLPSVALLRPEVASAPVQLVHGICAVRPRSPAHADLAWHDWCSATPSLGGGGEMTETALVTGHRGAEGSALLDTNVVARLADLARRQPRALAARADGVELDWEALERRSNAAARTLHARFGTGEEPICLCGLTGTDMAILPLAVVKSGRPYVWLDRDLPLPRIRQILELSRAVAIVGTVGDNLREVAPHQTVLNLATSGTADASPAVERRPEDPVTVLFTSGSTGVPKGVVTSHRYYLAHALSYADRPVGTGHRVALVVPMSFAYGTIIFLRTLLLGGTLLLFDMNAIGLAGLADWLDTERAEVMEGTPSLLRSLVRTLEPGRVLPALQMVDFGGEPVYGRDIAQLEAHLSPTCQIANVIGASELGVFCRYPVARGIERHGTVPVGRPEAYYDVSLVDEHGRPVPDGGLGEIVVTSSRCSSGYFAQPEQTVERFTELQDGRTRYRTGDLGRWEGGNLVHLGRADGMVKVRGYLVEPAEVEGALLDSGLVEECVVLGRVVEGEGGSLTAYVVPVVGQRVSVAAVRRDLRQRLPEYMVPRTIVLTETFPRNRTGKIDRLALSELATTTDDTPKVLPRTPWERAVWGAFADALGLEHFGVDDDFFGLGGDSLAAEELVTSLRLDYGAHVQAADLAVAPTVASLAERARWPDIRPSACVSLRAGGDRPPLFCIAGGGALAIAFVPLVRYLHPDRPVYGLQNPAVVGGGLPDWSVQSLARRFVKEVRARQPEGPYYLAGHSAGGVIAWEMAQQLARAGERVGLLVLIDTLRSDVADATRNAAFPGQRSQPSRSVARKLVRLGRDLARISLAGVRPHRLGSTQYELFFRHSELLLRRYRPRPWGGPAVVFLARASAEKGSAFGTALLTGRVETRRRPGDHFTIFREPHAEGFARELEEVLQRAQSAHADGSDIVEN